MSRLPESVRLVAFDLDGTLVNAYPAIRDSINYMLKQMGRPQQTLLTIKRSVGWGVDSLVRCFIEEERADEALAIFRAHHDQRLRGDIKLQPGAKALLAFLRKRNYRLAIASNRPTQFCGIILETLGIDREFFKVVGGDAVKRPKPYPDMLNLILDSAGVHPDEAIYVGDMTVDILCGRRAGVLTAAVPTGSCTLAEIQAEQPDFLVTNLGEFRRLFA